MTDFQTQRGKNRISRRMVLRTSGKSVFRMPLRSALSFLLIAAVTAFLYLGVNTFFSSVRLLRECDESYTTIASIEYLGDMYPNESAYDATMLAEVEKIDFDAIAQNENVLLWQPTDCSIGVIDGFVAHSSSVSYQLYDVLVITDVVEYGGDGKYFAEVADCLYSYKTDMQGKHIFFVTDGFEFEADRDAYYVIHGYSEGLAAFVSTIHLSSFYSYAATLSGVDCSSILPLLQVDSPETVRSDPDNVYLSIADYYNVMNSKIYVYRTQSPGELEEFHQQQLKVISGRLFTEEEALSGAKVCVLTETLADGSGLSVGDTLTLRTTDNTGLPAADCYWGAGSLSRSDEYTIVGIVNYYDGLAYNVYVPAVAESASPEKYIYKLGQATIQNGSAEAFTEEITSLLPARASLKIFDEGYQIVADSLGVIRGASAVLSAVALAAAVAVLLFFAHLFVEKQRGTVETMRCFGAAPSETRLYLLFGAGLIAFAAVLCGVWVGTRFAGGLMERSYSFVSGLQASDLRYSNGYLGVTRAFSPVTKTSVPLVLSVGAAVFLMALAACMRFAKGTRHGRVMQARTHTHLQRPPKRSSTLGRGGVRYSLLSIARNGAKTVVVPLLAAVMTLFVCTLLSTRASYEDALDSLYETSEIKGYCTTMAGKYAGNLVIAPRYAQMIADIEGVDDEAVTYTMSYQYLGVVEHADGTAGNAQEVPVPSDGFTQENMVNQLLAEPLLVFTNKISEAPEFYFGEFTGEFLPDWSADSFAERDWTEPFCALSTQFMEENGVSLGDTIRVYVLNTVGYYTGQGGGTFLNMEFRVVGSFLRQAGEDYIYAPLPAYGIDFGGLQEDSFVDGRRYNIGRGYLRRQMGNDDLAALSAQDLTALLLDERYVSSMSFTLGNAGQLTQVKDALEELGFSGPDADRDVRVAVTIEDKDFLESAGSVEQRIAYIDVLYPVLMALVCAVGVVAGVLMQNSRRGEVAVMRGLGTPKRRIFLSFFFEQAALLLFGTLIAAALWLALNGPAQLAGFDPYAFTACYALGTLCALIIGNRSRAIDILSEKE
ncbi:MAG TPA: ABC transporter permease [Eubacteriales bacterium]|nr:ABC transporter permease [Eubacteriales bacterium]